MSRDHVMERAVRSGRHGDVFPARAAAAPLPLAERMFFEPRLGHDFSRVRIHTDHRAAQLAGGLRARAFTVGDDIAFAAGRYRPETTAGRRLLAHELVHVAQQARPGGGARGAAEARAGAAAQQAADGRSVPPALQGSAAPGLYCAGDDDKKRLDDAAASPARSAMPFAGFTPSLALSGLPPLSGPLGGPQPVQPWFRMPPLGSPPGLAPLSVPGLASPSSPTPLAPVTSPALSPPLASAQPGMIAPPYHLMSNAEILAPFAAHGTAPSASGFNIQADWSRAFVTFQRYMPLTLAVTAANMFLPAAYQAALALERPSASEKLDADVKAAHPEEKRIPPIPLVSSSTLTLLYEAITKKKNTNAFYF